MSIRVTIAALMLLAVAMGCQSQADLEPIAAAPPPAPAPTEKTSGTGTSQAIYLVHVTKDAKVSANRDVVMLMHVPTGRLMAFEFLLGRRQFESIAVRIVSQDSSSARQKRTADGKTPEDWPFQSLPGPNLTMHDIAAGENGERVTMLLDHKRGRLLFYRLDAAKKRIELVGDQDLQKLFGLTAPLSAPTDAPHAARSCG